MDRIRIIFSPLLPHTYLKNALDEHIAIIEAIKKGDSVKAEKSMRKHIRGYWEILNQVV